MQLMHIIGLSIAASSSKMRFHDLRHTAASSMLNYDFPVIASSQRLRAFEAKYHTGYLRSPVSRDARRSCQEDGRAGVARSGRFSGQDFSAVRMPLNKGSGNQLHHNCTIKKKTRRESGYTPPNVGGKSSYTPRYRRPRRDLNSQPSDPKSGALSIELRGRRADYTVLL